MSVLRAELGAEISVVRTALVDILNDKFDLVMTALNRLHTPPQ